MTTKLPWKKRLLHWLEGLGAAIMFGFFSALPLAAASATGGFLARTLGPRVGASKRARINLRRALPELSDTEIERTIRGMWDNLGRVVAEYPNLRRFKIFDPKSKIEPTGSILRLKHEKPGPDERYIFISAHYGNWEIAALAVTQAGLDAVEIYRAANNPLVDRLMLRARGAIGNELVPKGALGARRMLAAIRSGRHICMLVDQKINDGMPIPFFGRDAMTGTAVALFALKYDCRIVPIQVERLGGTRFRVTFEEPMPVVRTGDREADTRALLTAINARIEGWVRARPDHWFWLHRRWPE
jgi:KDO2-lipid IV(A) lauroyltransferase